MQEADRYRALLLARRDEIVGMSRQREDIWIVQSNEQIETVQLAADREFAVRGLEHQSKTLMQVEEALQRMGDGKFGICLDCEQPISVKRLAAVPWAAYCLRCREAHDSLEATDTSAPILAA